MRRLAVLLLPLGFAVTGCSLDSEGELGTQPLVDATFDTTSPPDSSLPDAAADVGTDGSTADVVEPPIDAPADVVSEPPGPCSTAPGACVQSVAGWEVIAFASGAPAACPSGYTQQDAAADPALAAGACDCGCTITQEPCVFGTIPTYFGSSSCNNQGQSLPISGSGCVDFPGGNLWSFYRSPPVPVGGACVGAPVADPSKLTTIAARACLPPNGCLEEICNGQVPAGFESCIRAAGDLACPAGPFSNKHLLVDGASFSCSDCPTCSVSAQCQNPQLEFHSDNTCTNHVVTVASNNTCVGTGGSAYVSSVKYLVDVQNKVCSADGAKQASLSTQNPVTVCCR